MRFLKVVLAGGLIAGMLAVAGCSYGGGTAGDSAPVAGAPGADRDTDDLGLSSEEGASERTTATSAPVVGRSLIYRGDITVRVDDVVQGANRVTALAESAGGYVSSEKRSAYGEDAYASVTIRIPADKFSSVVEQVAELGEEEDRNTNIEDVTEAVVDLDTRIEAQRASVASVQRMFDQATKLEDLVLLERELSQRQAELAALEAKQRRLNDLVAMSTLSVSLIGPNTTFTAPQEPDPSFLGGLKAGWRAFVDSVQIGSAVVGFLVPFLGVLGIPILVLIVVLRARRRNRIS